MSLAEVQGRIAQIQQMFAPPASGGGAAGTAAASPDAFATTLAGALGTSGVNGTGPSTNHTAFAHDLLHALGMPDTAQNVRAINAWADAEGTRARFNPLATTQPMPGATSFNSVGVKDYASYADGIAATVATLRNGRYDAILAALARGDDARSVGEAVATSPWGTGAAILRRL